MIRKATLSDALQIARCEEVSFPLPLSEKSIEEMLKNPIYLFLAAEQNGVFAGHAVCCLAGDDTEIVSVAVLPEFRRQKHAERLMEEIKNISRQKNAENILLEVRASNLAAIRLYEKTGFTKIALRKNFYSTPPEDGITMLHKIKGKN